MYYNVEKRREINNSLEFRKEFPNISFPKVLTDELMEEYGYIKVVINEVTPNQFANIINGEIEVIDDIPTIQQSLVYKPLEECKEIAREKAKAIRDEAIITPINNVQVAREIDRENIQGAIKKFQFITETFNTSTIKWTMADNTESDLTLQDLENVLDTYIIRQAQAFGVYQSKKAQIEACTTVEELELVVI